MYDFVLITTGESRVKEELIQHVHAIKIIDCKNGREKVMMMLADCIEMGVKVLLTYRCPYIIPEELYSMVLYGAFNIHPSLLPSYSGMNPWDKIFADGVRQSGVTLHRLSREPDTGEIIAQEYFTITPEDSLISARVTADKKALKLLKFII